MIWMFRWIAVTTALAIVAGCGLLPDAYSSCEKPQAYQSAKAEAPLRVPSGSDMPDTRNALRIPDVSAPERPTDGNACLDHPPSYGAARPQTG
ncbi:MAG TPA: hypothetical protein VML92_10660 [Steroidobacteraceae bacterium]|nr:hypothetical protein [Steroidobacteraceae bacterium]